MLHESVFTRRRSFTTARGGTTAYRSTVRSRATPSIDSIGRRFAHRIRARIRPANAARREPEGRELATENTENASKLAAVEAKKQKLESLKRQLARTELRLENEKIELMTLEERSAELDRIAADNADELDAVRKEAAAHKDLMYKTSQELQRLRDTERV